MLKYTPGIPPIQARVSLVGDVIIRCELGDTNPGFCDPRLSGAQEVEDLDSPAFPYES